MKKMIALLSMLLVGGLQAQVRGRGPLALDQQKKCLKTDAAGNCVDITYHDGYYWTRTCTAPNPGECVSMVKIGNKQATCIARNGGSCDARVRGTATEKPEFPG